MKKIFFLFVCIIITGPVNAQTFSNSTGGPIPDNNTLVCFPVTVTGLPGQIDTTFGVVTACLDIIHTYDSDLRIYLKGPNNLMIELSSTNGGSFQNYTGTCFRMDGTSGYIIYGIPPFTGTFIPEESLNLFNSGIGPNGTWYLCVIDEVPSDTGSVVSFSITFGNNPPPDPQVTPGLCTTTDASGCACPLPGDTDCDLLPDMTASALEIQNAFFEYLGYIEMNNATPNIGYGPLEVRGMNQCFCDTMPVPCNIVCPDSSGPTELISQRIYHKNPDSTMSYYDIPAGTMTYHPSHGHIHVDDWAHYSLRTPTSDPDARNWPIVGLGTKTSYCLVNLGDCNSAPGICQDSGVIYNQSNLPNYGLGIVSGCGTEQGIFVGNYDVYSANLDGQRIYIPDICNGNYHIVSITDPDNHFREMNDENNWVSVPVTLSMQPGNGAIPAFTHSPSGMSVAFSNSASGNNTYYWDFGDGQLDSLGQSVNHTYTVPGTYTVVLIIDNGICKSTSAQLVTVPGYVGISDGYPMVSPVNITPNPSSGEVRLSYQLHSRAHVRLLLCDALGNRVKVFSNGINLAGSYEFRLNAGEIAPGIYFVSLLSDESSETARLVIIR